MSELQSGQNREALAEHVNSSVKIDSGEDSEGERGGKRVAPSRDVAEVSICVGFS